MSRTDAWMPLHIAAYTADTLHLTTLQHGAYFLLLMHYWRTGPLLDDDGVLASIAKLDRRVWDRQVASVVRQFFTAQNGRLHQKRCDAEREKAADISKKRSDAAHASHRRRDPETGGNEGAGGQQKPSKRSANVVQMQQANAAPANAVVSEGNVAAEDSPNFSAEKQVSQNQWQASSAHVQKCETSDDNLLETLECASANAGANAGANGLQTDLQTDCKQPHTRVVARPLTKKESPSLRSGDAPANADAPDLPDVRHLVWSEGVAIYRRLTGKPEKQARSYVGKLLRDSGDDCAVVLNALQECPFTLDANAWLAKAIQVRTKPASESVHAQIRREWRLGTFLTPKFDDDDDECEMTPQPTYPQIGRA